MKSTHLLRFLLILFTLSLALQTFADSGKFWIGRPGLRWYWPSYTTYYPPRPFNPYYLPPYYYNNWRYQQNQNYSHNYEYSVSLKSNTSSNQNQSAQIVQYADPRGMVVDDFGGGSGAGFGLFSEEKQQAVIAWNGHNDEKGEEVLILTTNEQINEKLGKSAITLNVVPLPGEPIDILPADSKIFEKTKELMNEKYVADASGSGFPAVMHKKVGSHEIFVWRIDEQENFKNAVMTYVKEKFEGKLVIHFTKEMEDVINSYFKRGFRYFAFDLSHVEETNTTREAIAYHFKSQFVYFPLVISQIGGMPDTTTIVDMIVMTPGKITMKPIQTNKEKVISDENVFVVRNQAVKFTQAEVKELDPTLAKVLSEFPEVTVRNILLQGDLVGFQNDFMAIGVK